MIAARKKYVGVGFTAARILSGRVRRADYWVEPARTAPDREALPTIPMCETLRPLLRGLPAGPVVRYNGRALGSIKTAFHKARDRAGPFSDVTRYTIRHTTAFEMRKRGVAVREVAGFLGHSSGYEATGRYAKYGADHLSQAVRAIDCFFADLAAVCGPLPGLPSTVCVRVACCRVKSQRDGNRLTL